MKLNTSLLAFCAAIINNHRAININAMVAIDAHYLPRTIPNPSIQSVPTTPQHQHEPSPIRRANINSTARKRRFRIRRTQASDLDAISTMLAMESMPPSQETWNWNDGMKHLRIKSQLGKQLAHRLAVLEEGRKVIENKQKMVNDDDHDDDVCSILSEDDTLCHALWTNDNFRSKLKTAVSNSQEENAWTSHNFNLAPTYEMLNHVMMSVEEVSSGDVIGFCEVAWLPSPTIITSSCHVDNENIASFLQSTNINYDEGQRIHVSNDSLDIPSQTYYCQETPNSYCQDISSDSYHFDDEQLHASSSTIQCAPSIVNLITSPSHRQMGIASRILSFASKYTTTQWRSTYCHDENNMLPRRLGLYVDPENKSALRLYIKKGFSVVSSPVDGQDGLLYCIKE